MGMGRLVLSDTALVHELRFCAKGMLRVDGDRDNDMTSNMRVDALMAVVQLMRAAADRISGAIDPQE